MQGSESRPPAGAVVKPCPGRSGATTVKRRASSGSRPRQEWVAAPVPWTSSSTGPSPACWTCQRSPPAWTKRLAARLGQSRPSLSHCGRSLIGRRPASAWDPVLRTAWDKVAASAMGSGR